MMLAGGLVLAYRRVPRNEMSPIRIADDGNCKMLGAKISTLMWTLWAKTMIGTMVCTSLVQHSSIMDRTSKKRRVATSALRLLLGRSILGSNGPRSDRACGRAGVEDRAVDETRILPMTIRKQALPSSAELLTRSGRLPGTRKLTAASRIAEQQSGLSFLETNAATPQTATNYGKCVKDFIEWVVENGGERSGLAREGPMRDWILEYFDDLFHRGYGPDTGSLALAVVHVAARRLPIMALAIVLATVAYLRPGALLALKVRHMLRPLPGVVGAGGACYSLLVSDRELGVPSKTGTYDDHVLLDRPDLMWMNAWWETLVTGRVNVRCGGAAGGDRTRVLGSG